MKLDESCISDPKSEISDWSRKDVQFEVSDFGSEMQDSSNFTISSRVSAFVQNLSSRTSFGRAG